MPGAETPTAGRPVPPPLYRTQAGEARIRALYDKMLAGLPYKHEEKFVKTSYCDTHVLIVGLPKAPPLVVWHGMSAPGPFMMRMFDTLVPHFRIYLPDQPYQAGSRTQDALLRAEHNEHGKWALEVLQALGLAPAANGNSKKAAPQQPLLHIGVSFGGAVTIDLAQVAPEVIQAAVLLVPGGLMPINANLGFLFRFVLPSMLYRLLPCNFTAWLALFSMSEEPVPEHLEIVLLAWRYILQWSPLPGGPAGFPAKQLARLAAPTLVIAAEHDIFWPGQAAAAAAEAAIPDCKGRVIPGAKHLPARQKQLETMDWILDFFAEKGFYNPSSSQ